MIKAEVTEKSISIEAKGELSHILTDVTFIIGGIYEELPDGQRELFREALTHAINDEEGPVWRAKE